MTQAVTTQDGTLHTFPDEATPEMIAGALGVAPPAPEQQPQQADQISGAGRAWQGVQDIPNGMAQLMLHGAQQLPDSVVNAVPGLKGADNYLDNDLHNQEQNYQARRAASGSDGIDWYRMGGNAAASLPLVAALPGAGATTAVGRLGAGALQGAVAGASQPDFDAQNGGYWTDKGYQTAGGAAVGGALNPVLGAAGAAIAPKVSTAAQYLMDKGITPTIGQIMGGPAKALEEKATSIPGVGDAITNAYARGLRQFNSVALNSALEPIGAATDKVGRAGVDDVATKLGSAYDQVLPRLNLKLNDQLAQGILDAKAGLQPQQATQFDNIIGNQFNKFGDTDTLTGDTLKGFQSEITNEAKGYGGDASYDQQKLGQALDKVGFAIRDNLQDSNPQDAKLLQNINQGYAQYARLRTAGQMAKSDRGFTPAELATAIRQNDQSVGNGAFARGDALLQNLSDPAVETLGSKYPDSGTAGRHAVEAIAATMVGHAAAPDVVLPAAMASGAASVPYLTEGTQKLAAALLSKRPGFARPVSDAAQALAPYISTGAAGYSQR